MCQACVVPDHWSDDGWRFPSKIRFFKSRFFASKNEPGFLRGAPRNIRRSASTNSLQSRSQSTPIRLQGTNSTAQSKRCFPRSMPSEWCLPRKWLREGRRIESSCSLMRCWWSKIFANTGSEISWHRATWYVSKVTVRNQLEALDRNRPRGVSEVFVQVPPSLNCDEYTAMLTNEWILRQISDAFKQSGLLW